MSKNFRGPGSVVGEGLAGKKNGNLGAMVPPALTVPPALRTLFARALPSLA